MPQVSFGSSSYRLEQRFREFDRMAVLRPLPRHTPSRHRPLQAGDPVTTGHADEPLAHRPIEIHPPLRRLLGAPGRRQVYAVCASLTALRGMTVEGWGMT